ncbi:MAG TPA: hypothetical protein VIB39_20060 [Candidatus Angelobacter sp.]
MFFAVAAAQSPPQQLYAGEPLQVGSLAGAPEAPRPHFAQMKSLLNPQQMKSLIKTQMNRVIDGKPYPAVTEWQPLTTRQKFDVFLHSTYSPSTFLNAGIDVVADRAKGRHDPEYETGMMGWGQHYGIALATSETDVFFQRFLFPALLKQDPRYYRNPDLPFFKRALYSMSRVVITRSDSGGETINASRILGGAATRALSDLYVPGQSQGMRPISNTVSFDLLRDAGMNLLHEFWPDLRRKFLHR